MFRGKMRGCVGKMEVMKKKKSCRMTNPTIFQVVSKDPRQSGGVGWWAGMDKTTGKTGAFPANCVELDTTAAIESFVEEEHQEQSAEPPEIRADDLKYFEMVGSGGFGRVFRALWKQAPLGGAEKIVAVKVATCNQHEDTEQV